VTQNPSRLLLDVYLAARRGQPQELRAALAKADAAGVALDLSMLLRDVAKHAMGDKEIHLWAGHGSATALVLAAGAVGESPEPGECVEILLPRAGPGALGPGRRNNETPLAICARRGDERGMRALIAAGSDVNAVCSASLTILMKALHSQNPNCVRLIAFDPRCDLFARDDPFEDREPRDALTLAALWNQERGIGPLCEALAQEKSGRGQKLIDHAIGQTASVGHWGVVERMAPFSPAEADRIMAGIGAGKMPAWAARREAEAIEESLADARVAKAAPNAEAPATAAPRNRKSL
jgi:hypothetical protein